MRSIVVLLLVLWCSQAKALESNVVGSDRAQVSVITEAQSYLPGKPFRIGLRFRLAPGWHIYWQNPGDAGAAPTLSLSVPSGGIVWPAPQRLSDAGVISYAYTGEIVLPVTVAAQDGAATLSIDARSDWLVCADVCVPETGKFHLVVPSGNAAPSPEAGLFAATDLLIPRKSPFAVTIAPDGTLSATGAPDVRKAWFLPAAWGSIDQAADQPFSARPGGFSLGLKPGEKFDPHGVMAGVLAVQDRSGATAYLAIAAEPGASPPPALGLGQILLLALLGGMVLNLMPCVFPVLALKAFGLVGRSAAGQHHLRAHALSYAAGVLVTFAGLAAVLLGLRAAGSAAGWGFQFQTPVFVAAMAWLLFGVGLNLSGVFQVGSHLSGAGQSLVSRGGHAGSFFTGLLAVLVATPCTAPFMGPAIAAGLASPPVVTVLVFLAMGVGLATPYVALAMLPGIARLLPRPGRWMEIFKQALAFPMYAAAAWLVWVVSQEAGPAGVLGTATGLVLLGLAGWAYGAAQGSARIGRRIGKTIAMAAVLAALAVMPGIEPSAAGHHEDASSEKFTAARLAQLRAEGRPVFVNMTAAWCVTCLINERIALAPEAVRQAFAAANVAYLKGDWTQQDPEITSFLRSHQRDGVPLYVFFPPGRDGEVLPQILTQSEVISLTKG